MRNSRTLLFAVAAATTFSFYACGGNNHSETTTDTAVSAAPVEPEVAPAPATTAPVGTAAADAELNTKVTDAIKDYPGVTAAINNGEVTLTGEVKKADLPKVLQAVNATSPAKVNNQLTVK
jgi:osmotically-inducible protein OsmY